MSSVRVRAWRGAVAVCSMLWTVAAVAGARETGPSARETSAPAEPLRIGDGRASVFAYAPRDASSARPVAVYLNGLCGVTTNGCPHFRDGTASFGWLVCPPANAPCPGGGASWGGSTEARGGVVDAAVSVVKNAYPDAVDDAQPALLIGFSQGAYTALDLARRRPGRYRALFLIGAYVETDPGELRAAGVERVVLAAGRYDGAAPRMAEVAQKLARGGYPAKFASLGAVGHTYAAEDASVLASSLAWLEEGARARR